MALSSLSDSSSDAFNDVDESEFLLAAARLDRPHQTELFERSPKRRRITCPTVPRSQNRQASLFRSRLSKAQTPRVAKPRTGPTLQHSSADDRFEPHSLIQQVPDDGHDIHEHGSRRGETGERNTENTAGLGNGLRQATLFGGAIERETTSHDSHSKPRAHNWPLARKEEPPTHHRLNREALETYVYPLNLGTSRDYQFNIVRRGLFHNLLVALPTGLGKTFIAATVMLNFFRWLPDSQILFVAPTKPLVSQQVQACFHIAGIPRSATTMLTGETAPGLRAEEWTQKRVFFMTPQTIVNDLRCGTCDPKRIALVVVDEAHRATGAYAYVEVVKFLRRFNTSFRVLALTATPGSSIETVQDVIDSLGISRVEIRTEESLDIRSYVHQRNVDTVLFQTSDEMALIMELFSKTLQPLVTKVASLNAYWSRDPMSLSAYGCMQSRQKWMNSQAGRAASMGMKGMINSIFTVLASLAHAIELLKYHGIGPFYHKVADFETETLDSKDKGGKYRRQVVDDEKFRKMVNILRAWNRSPEFIGHPKLDYLQGAVLAHFVDAREGRGEAAGLSASRTRIMIFAHYRDSAEEIARVLRRHEPIVKPHVFVGQATAKGSEGMDQKRQLEVIQKFKDGDFNTLVATSIGEEGLDIGEVDLILCYDASASPIRMLQRMGRTGRKRAGNIKILLMEGKEQRNFEQAKDSYAKMQQLVASGERFSFHDDLSPRIVPREINPQAEMKTIEIPLENTQGDLPEPKKRKGRQPKRPPKKFHLPDNARLGFTRASRLDDSDNASGEESAVGVGKRHSALRVPSPEHIPPLSSVLLSASMEKHLDRTYREVQENETQLVAAPTLDAFPALQRQLRPIAKVEHGSRTRRLVEFTKRVHSLTADCELDYRQNLDPMDRLSIDAFIAKHQAAAQKQASDKADETSISRAPAIPPRICQSISSRNSVDVENDDLLADFLDDGSQHSTAKESDTSLSLMTPPEKLRQRISMAKSAGNREQITSTQATASTDDDLNLDLDELLGGGKAVVEISPLKQSRVLQRARNVVEDSDEE